VVPAWLDPMGHCGYNFDRLSQTQHVGRFVGTYMEPSFFAYDYAESHSRDVLDGFPQNLNPDWFSFFKEKRRAPGSESRLLGQLDSWIKFMKDISAHNVFSTAEAKADKGALRK